MYNAEVVDVGSKSSTINCWKSLNSSKVSDAAVIFYRDGSTLVSPYRLEIAPRVADIRHPSR